MVVLGRDEHEAGDRAVHIEGDTAEVAAQLRAELPPAPFLRAVLQPLPVVAEHQVLRQSERLVEVLVEPHGPQPRRERGRHDRLAEVPPHREELPLRVEAEAAGERCDAAVPDGPEPDRRRAGLEEPHALDLEP